MPILVDYNQAIIASSYVAQEHMSEVKTDAVRHLFLSGIAERKKRFEKYGEVIICADSGNNWRKEVFPYYKAARKKSRAESPLDWNAVFEAADTIRKELDEEFPYKVVKVDRCEADDIIAVLCKYYAENEHVVNGLVSEPQRVMILSTDKDFRQLQAYGNVDQWSPITKKRLREDDPEAYLKEHIIRGDAGDGVPNFLSPDDIFTKEGVRQKAIRTVKLEKWLDMSPEDICENDEQLRNYYRNKKMVDLMTEIPEDLQDAILNTFAEAKVAPRAGLFNYFVRNKLRNLMPQINLF